jgi:hypothetical protein
MLSGGAGLQGAIVQYAADISRESGRVQDSKRTIPHRIAQNNQLVQNFALKGWGKEALMIP